MRSWRCATSFRATHHLGSLLSLAGALWCCVTVLLLSPRALLHPPSLLACRIGSDVNSLSPCCDTFSRS
eukprot:590840-Rhodomonas_salina.1